MKISFRQGIVREQTDSANNPTFLQFDGSVVSLIVTSESTIVAFAHGSSSDYLFEETSTVTGAWSGPFTVNVDYWLYWDIDLLSGLRTFGHTVVEPVVSATAPAGPIADQHWFDTTTYTMKVYTSGTWIEKIRVFAAKLSKGAVLVPYLTGTQVGINTTTFAGSLIFDDDGNAVKKFDRFGRGKFITTETPISSQTTSLVNFRLEALVIDVQALETIPAFYAIAFQDTRKVGLASYTTPQYPAVGVALEDMNTNEVRTFLKTGYLTNELWNWTEAAGTKLFVGSSGQLTANVPQLYSIQEIATVVSPQTLYIDVKPIVLLQ